MPLRARIFLCASLAFACLGIEAAESQQGFSYSGFSLGMSRAEANSIHPEVNWQPAMLIPSEKFLRKEFDGEFLDRTAKVTVDLDPSGNYVRMIGFTFMTSSDQQCIDDAVRALAKLESQHGEESEVFHEPPGKRAKWAPGNAITVRWGELCAAGATRYYITYAQNGG